MIPVLKLLWPVSNASDGILGIFIHPQDGKCNVCQTGITSNKEVQRFEPENQSDVYIVVFTCTIQLDSK
jgi:hypothetical protein